MYFTATTVCKPTFLLEENIFSTEFRNAILKDYESINEHYLGAKTKKDFKKWIVDGQFFPLQYGSDKYIYGHSRSAFCSNVTFSQLTALWDIDRVKILKRLQKCAHVQHDF